MYMGSSGHSCKGSSWLMTGKYESILEVEEKDDGGRGSVESEVEVCQSALS